MPLSENGKREKHRHACSHCRCRTCRARASRGPRMEGYPKHCYRKNQWHHLPSPARLGRYSNNGVLPPMGNCERCRKVPLSPRLPAGQYLCCRKFSKWVEIGRYKAPSMDQERPPEQSPQKRERCPQNMFDPILQKFVLASKNTKILYNHRFCSLENLSNGIRINAEDTKQKGK